MPACNFRSADVPFNLKGKKKYTQWLHQIIKEHHAVPGDLVFVFCTDEYLIKYNIEYLNHHTLTDIITFDYSENNVISGDILISVERVRENALQRNIPFNNELCRVMVHGVLHLLGYHDKAPADKSKMRKAEDLALSLLT
jgi:rRNA maturation RNase YbeY